MNKINVFILIAFSLFITKVFGQDNSETSGKRQYYDSAHFSIILGEYQTGERFLKCYINKETRLDYWTTYYKNGQRKEIGYMTTRNHIYVGEWKYYKENGQLDSIVNYDEIFPISYFDAIEIAKTKDFPKSHISETTHEQKEYWQFVRWTNKEGEVLLVNKQTGEIVMPNLIMISSH
jgi:hypothetical protein